MTTGTVVSGRALARNGAVTMDTNTVGLVAPFASSANLQLAQQAVTILQANGQAVGALPIVNGAAGYANAARITAMSLLSQVAAIDQDSVVQPTRPTTGGPAWPPGQIGSLSLARPQPIECGSRAARAAASP